MPTKILPHGNPSSPVWVIADRPYEKDSEKGYIYSGGYGYVFNRAWSDAGITEQPFITSLVDELGDNNSDLSSAYQIFASAIDYFKPSIICTMGKKVTALFCPFTKTRSKKKGESSTESSLEKYAGSLLSSPDISYPHYIIPLLSPDSLASNFSYRTVYVQIDLGHVREEVDYYRTNKRIQDLPKRSITLQPSYPELIDILESYKNATYLGNDIETIRAGRGSLYYGQFPGHLYTIALAPAKDEAVAFAVWDYEPGQVSTIFRRLQELFTSVSQIGQNFFTFDSHYYEAYGLTFDYSKVYDTMLRHQILWPELPHKLQFLTKQYTRQPYYKDEGKGWSPKHKKAFLHYNALDAMVTHEVWLGQEEEFKDREYLR